MLTVLIRYKKTRREVLTPCTAVEWQPASSDQFPHEYDPGLLIRTGDNSATFLSPSDKDDPDWRDVFVMNENGQTVARYTL